MLEMRNFMRNNEKRGELMGNATIDSYFYSGLDKRQVKTKKAIFTALLIVSEKKDISKITITELSRTANIDRKTFYIHFGNVENVLNELLRKTEFLVRDLLSAHMQAGKKLNPSTLFMNVNALVEEKRDFFQRAVDGRLFNILADCVINTFCDELIKAYSDAINDATEEFKLVADFLSKGTVAMYTKWLRGETKVSLDDLARLSGDVIIHGVAGIAEQIL